MGPPPRSLAVEADDCFMVRVQHGSNRIQGRSAMLRAQWAGSPRVVPTRLDIQIPIQGAVRDAQVGAGFSAFDMTGPAAGHPSLGKLAQGTVCKILAQQEVQPHKVRYLY